MNRKKIFGNGGIVYSTSPETLKAGEKEEPAALAPASQLLKIRLDTKQRGGKVVTLVQGFVLPEKDLENVAKKLKTHCGTGGSYKDDEVMIQGDHREKVLQWLLKNGFSKAKKL
jgi:translation initiation factor 1